MSKSPWLTVVAILTSFLPSIASAQSFDSYAYDIGNPVVRDVYIDPILGSDSATGSSPATAWRSVSKAWNSLPNSTPLTQGIRINLLPGTYTSDHLPNYWDLKQGTYSAPIILQAAQGLGTVTFSRDINMANVSYFYLLNVNITPVPAGDAFHGEGMQYVLLRGNIFNGGSTEGGAHETVKFNQSQYVYIENNDIRFADDNNVDLVAVQYGHMIGNKLHDAPDWCGYAKGGSAYFRVEGNEFYNCGVGGFTAGQGTGGEFMVSPWIHYEAYDIKIINNVVHDTFGAAFGVNGGYNILIAHNTAYRIGRRSHLLEVVFGERSCDGADVARCAAFNAAGGWIPSVRSESGSPIGDRNVYILNNIFYNPAGSDPAPQMFAIYEPRTPSAGNNLPAPQVTDTNLVIRGNVIWNGEAGTPLGFEGTTACSTSNPTCSEALVRSQNDINTILPQFNNFGSSDVRPLDGGNLTNRTVASLVSFPGGDRVATPLAPQGVLENIFSRDLSGTNYSSLTVPGAFQSSQSPLTPPNVGGSPPPSGNPDPPSSGGGSAPALSIKSAKITPSGKKFSVAVTATASDSDGDLASVTATVVGPKGSAEMTLSEKRGKFVGSVKLSGKKGKKFAVTVTAVDAASHTTTASKSVKIK